MCCGLNRAKFVKRYGFHFTRFSLYIKGFNELVIFVGGLKYCEKKNPATSIGLPESFSRQNTRNFDFWSGAATCSMLMDILPSISTKNSGFNFEIFGNGIFFTRLDRSRSISLLRFTRKNTERSWWSECLKCRKPLNSCNEIERTFTIIISELFSDIYLTQTLFSCDERNLRNLQTRPPDPREIRKFNPNVFEEDRQSRTGSFSSSVVSSRRHLEALLEAKFMTRGTRAKIVPGRNAMWNRKSLDFQIFQKKGQLREVDWNFRKEFPESFSSMRFWTGILKKN